MGMQLPDFDTESIQESRKESQSAGDAISNFAGSLPSSMKELKEAADITKSMRQGTNDSSASNETSSLSEILKTLPGSVANKIADALKGEKPSERPGHGSNSVTDGSLQNLFGDSKGKSGSGQVESPNSGSTKPSDTGGKSGSGSNERPGKGAGGDAGGAPRPSDKGGRSNDISDAVRSIEKDILSSLAQRIPSDKQGVMKLTTGDTYIRANGTEILITPSKEVVMVNKDGSIDIGESKGVKISRDKSGSETTLTYPNGDTVTISGNRITGVNRGIDRVRMPSAKQELMENWENIRPIPRPYPIPDPFDRHQNKPVPAPDRGEQWHKQEQERINPPSFPEHLKKFLQNNEQQSPKPSSQENSALQELLNRSKQK
jgi:hypothetical protein